MSECVYMQYRKCLVECSEASFWSRGHAGLLLSNEHSSAPSLCLSVRPALLLQSVCAQPTMHPCLTTVPARAEPQGADRLTREPGLRGLQNIPTEHH